METILVVTLLLWMGSIGWGFYRFWRAAWRAPEERVRRILQKELAPSQEQGSAEKASAIDAEWEKQAQKFSEPLFPTVSKMFAGTQWMSRLERELRRARINADAGNVAALLALVWVGSVTLAALFTARMWPDSAPLTRLAAALLASLVVPTVFLLHLKGSQKKFIARIETILPDTLALMANVLRSGIGFQQALEIASREGLPPLREELAQVQREMNLGATINDALLKLVDRVASPELRLVVTAVLIQREVGGSLAKIFESAAETTRARIRLHREIHTLTAPARYSAFILTALPVFTTLALNLITAVTAGEPWSAPIVRDPVGWIAVLIAGLLLTAGFFFLNSMMKVEE